MSKYKEFEDYGEDLANRVSALISLYAIAPKNMPSGSILQLELEDGTQLQVSKKQLKGKRAELDLELRKLLPKKLKRATKRKRNTNPSDFTGAYTPVFVAAGLRKFVELVDFGHVDPTDTSSPRLIDQLHCIQRGYGLRNSFQLLWFIAIYQNEVQDQNDKTFLFANESISQAFGDYPAKYTNMLDDDDKLVTRENTEKLSTFDVLEHRNTLLDKKDKEFDRKRFRIYAFPIILSINIFKTSDLSQELKDTLKSEQVRTRFLEEFNIIKETKDKWKAHLKSIREKS